MYGRCDDDGQAKHEGSRHNRYCQVIFFDDLFPEIGRCHPVDEQEGQHEHNDADTGENNGI